MCHVWHTFFDKLRARFLTCHFFVRSQRLVARNVDELFSSNCAVSHFFAACCINELSGGSISSPESSLVASKKMYDSRLAKSCYLLVF